VSDWTWEYIPDSARVVGGLTPDQCAEVEALAQRIADAVTVRMIGRPFNPEEAVSGLKSYGEGLVTPWYHSIDRTNGRHADVKVAAATV
jgi:hypothetical protein